MGWVLWYFITEGLWYFLDFYDIGICVLDDPDSYSIGRAMVFAGIGVIMALSVEAFTSFSNGTVFVSKVGEWPALEWAAAHLVFPLLWQTTPIFNSHVTLQHLPFPVFSLLTLPQASLPAHPGCSSLANIPIRLSSHTFSLPEIRQAFFQLLACNISLPQYSLSILKWWCERSHFSLYPPNEQSSVLKYFSSVVTETAIGFSPKNQKDNYT